MKKVVIIISIIVLLIVIITISGILWYKSQLKPTNTAQVTEEIIEIQQGTKTEEILNLLHKKNLIKNVTASKIYIKLNDIKGLQAGKYNLNSKMSLEDILNQISSGNVVNEEITITFLEGKNIKWVASKIAEETNNTEEQVYALLNDKAYIQSLINKYWFLTDEITNKDIYYPLEGYLYPETYKFANADVSVEEIFNVLLEQTDKQLKSYQYQIQSQNLSVHQVLTMASMIELEGRDDASKKEIASVFYNRLKKNMPLGSDVTTYYAIKVDMGERDLYADEINQYNPYNTRGPNMEGKLPVGPISMISKSSIEAVLNPEDTDYLYFVADMNGKIYFSKNYEEHKNIVEQLQKQGLWYEYDK